MANKQLWEMGINDFITALQAASQPHQENSFAPFSYYGKADLVGGRDVIGWTYSDNVEDSEDEANWRVVQKEMTRDFPNEVWVEEYGGVLGSGQWLMVRALDDDKKPTNAIYRLFEFYQAKDDYYILDEDVHEEVCGENPYWYHRYNEAPWPNASTNFEVLEEVEYLANEAMLDGEFTREFQVLLKSELDMVKNIISEGDHLTLYQELLAMETDTELRKWIDDNQLDMDFLVWRTEQPAEQLWRDLPEGSLYIQWADDEDTWNIDATKVEILTQCLRDILNEAKMKEREGHIVEVQVGSWHYATEIS